VMTEADRHLWAKTYESNPDNVLAAQEEVTRDVVHQVVTVFPKSD
jgi:TolB-like protein